MFDLGITQVQPGMQSAQDGTHTSHRYRQFSYLYTKVIYRGCGAAEQICTCDRVDTLGLLYMAKMFTFFEKCQGNVEL